MKERPILFNGEMVRAILDGRKTQTRRPVKPQPVKYGDDGAWIHPATESEPQWAAHLGDAIKWACPFGQVGDRLWVRETWAHDAPSLEECRSRFEDFFPSSLPYGPYFRADSVHEGTGLRWRPSIHMPRWACRIVLEITDVRVERVQEISKDDAVAEGCDESKSEQAKTCGYFLKPTPKFITVWNSCYSARGLGWNENPLVWVIDFKRVAA